MDEPNWPVPGALIGIAGILFCFGALLGIVTMISGPDPDWKNAAGYIHVNPLKGEDDGSFLITASLKRKDTDQERPTTLADARVHPLLAETLNELRKKGALSVLVFESTFNGSENKPLSLLVVVNKEEK